MSEQKVAERETLPLGRIALYGLLAIVGSVVANLIIRAIGLAIVDVNENFTPLSEPTPTIVFTAGLVFIAVVVFGVIDRVSSNPVRLYRIVALAALIISIIPDIGLLFAEGSPVGDATLGGVIILILMHIAAYAVTVYTLTVLAYRK